MSGLTNHLVVFAKSPRVGRVKSRLAKDIGPVNAWKFYRSNLMNITKRMAADTRWNTWLALTPDRAPIPAGLPACITHLEQGGGDLGTRMNNAMVDLPPGPVVIIGTDIPDIRKQDIAQAFHVLGYNDTVFGPAEDGGYWLAGCRRRPHFPDIFKDVRWSTEQALSDTLANVSAGGYTTGMLRVLDDIDDTASYERWLHHNNHSLTAIRR